LISDFKIKHKNKDFFQILSSIFQKQNENQVKKVTNQKNIFVLPYLFYLCGVDERVSRSEYEFIA
jgi:hypothetical protein